MAGKLPKVMPAALVAVLLAFTGMQEGLRTTAYKDVGGVPTICYGETHNVKLGDTASLAECKERLSSSERGAYEDLGHYVTVALSGGEQIAYTDFIYNVGSARFAGSSLRRKLNAGDHRGACSELLKWVYVQQGGKSVRSKGLENRRKAEYAYCIKELN